MPRTITINRAPVLTLWAAVMAERLGCEWHEALTLGRAIAGLTAHSKGERLGLFEPTPEAVKDKRHELQAKAGAFHVSLLGRAVPAVHTKDGVRALDDSRPANPASVEKYLAGKFGGSLQEATEAMRGLARSKTLTELPAIAFHLYEQFRPSVPEGEAGWGARGVLDLDRIAAVTDGRKLKR